MVECGIHGFLDIIAYHQSAIQCRIGGLIPNVFDHTVGYKADIFRVEIVIHHREDDIQIPFPPVLTNHFGCHLGGWERRGRHFLSISVNHVGDHIGYFGNLVTTELKPFLVLRGIFLFSRIISVSGLELLDHSRVIAEIPLRIFLVLYDTVFRPKGSRQDNVHETVVIDCDTVQALYLAVSLYFLLDKLPYLG